MLSSATVSAALAFTSPSAHLVASTRAPSASMAAWHEGPADSIPKMIGLTQSAWPSEYDTSTTLGDFCTDTSFCSTDSAGRVVPTAQAASVPVDSVPQLIGLEKSAWPSEYDSQSTLGAFVHTSTCTTNEEGRVVAAAPAPSAPVDSVPQLIGLEKSAWPSEYDSETTLGAFVHTSTCTTNDEGRVVAATPAPSVPVDSVPQLIGLEQSAWPSEYDRQASLGGFVTTNYAAPTAPTLAASVPEPVEEPAEEVAEDAAEEEA